MPRAVDTTAPMPASGVVSRAFPARVHRRVLSFVENVELEAEKRRFHKEFFNTQSIIAR